MDIVRNVELALVFALIGIVVFVLSFVIIDRMTPYDLWREIVQEKNMALALLIGAMSIGICIFTERLTRPCPSRCSCPSSSSPPAG
jgi:uncharacterized membrane protein YjfL (UPF0719 family)